MDQKSLPLGSPDEADRIRKSLKAAARAELLAEMGAAILAVADLEEKRAAGRKGATPVNRREGVDERR